MSEPTMRERLARAAANALYEKCGSDMEVRFPEDCSLDDAELARYEGLMAAVDAILAELREPTPGMERAMMDASDEQCCYLDAPAASAAFTAAIDEAGKPT